MGENNKIIHTHTHTPPLSSQDSPILIIYLVSQQQASPPKLIQKDVSEIRMDTLNLMETEKLLVRELNMWLNSTEANPQGKGHPHKPALTLPSHIWNAYRTVYIPPTCLGNYVTIYCPLIS